MSETRPGVALPKSFDTQVQDIASAAHRRGVALTLHDQVVGALEARELCRTLRAAHENTRGDAGRHDHVRRIANAIALRLGVAGPVVVARVNWNVLSGYAAARRIRAGA